MKQEENNKNLYEKRLIKLSEENKQLCNDIFMYSKKVEKNDIFQKELLEKIELLEKNIY